MVEKDLEKIISSSGFLLMGFALSGVLSMLVRIIAGRMLGPGDYGLLSEGLAVMNFLVVIGLMGTTEGVSRFVAHKENGLRFASAAVIISIPASIILAAGLFLGAGSIASIIGQPDLTIILQVFALNIPATPIIAIVINSFRGKKRTAERILIEQIGLQGLILLLMASLLLYSSSATMAAMAYVVPTWIMLIVSGYIYRRRYELVKPTKEDILELLDFSLPLWLGDFFMFGLVWLNILFLGYFVGSEASGIYNAALPVSYGLTLLLSAINYLFMPTISQLDSNGAIEGIRSAFDHVTKWLFLSTTPLALIMILKPDTLIGILFGAAYATAAPVLAVLALARYIDTVFGPTGTTLIALGRTRRETLSRAGGLLGLIITSIVLIPIYGALGAAAGFLVGHIISNAMRAYYVRSAVDTFPLNTSNMKIALLGTAVGIATLLGDHSQVLDLLSIIMFLGAYTAAMFFLKPLNGNDLLPLQNAIGQLPLPKRYRDLIVQIPKLFVDEDSIP